MPRTHIDERQDWNEHLTDAVQRLVAHANAEGSGYVVIMFKDAPCDDPNCNADDCCTAVEVIQGCATDELYRAACTLRDESHRQAVEALADVIVSQRDNGPLRIYL